MQTSNLPARSLMLAAVPWRNRLWCTGGACGAYGAKIQDMTISKFKTGKITKLKIGTVRQENFDGSPENRKLLKEQPSQQTRWAGKKTGSVQKDVFFLDNPSFFTGFLGEKYGFHKNCTILNHEEHDVSIRNLQKGWCLGSLEIFLFSLNQAGPMLKTQILQLPL